MVHEAVKVKFQVLQSEIEALLVEAELVRLHQPPFNALLKDDKSPIYILITKEDFPRVLTVRKQQWEKHPERGVVFGPFPSSYRVRQVLRIARTVFGWCNDRQKKHPCFFYHIHLCPGPCAGVIDKETYNDRIDHVKKFLRGKFPSLVRELNWVMKEHVRREQYEEASVVRDQIRAIEEITSPDRAWSPQLDLPSLMMNEKKEALIELKQLLETTMSLPNEFVFSRIEGYDISNTQGTNPTASMVVFTDGEKDLAEYRIFYIRTKQTPDDFTMMREALTRRQKHPEWGYPSLVLIDGGKGQLSSVLSVWQWTNPVVSIAKKPDRLIVPVRDNSSRSGWKYITIDLSVYPRILHLLAQVRDESHRFAKKRHDRLRTRQSFVL